MHLQSKSHKVSHLFFVIAFAVATLILYTIKTSPLNISKPHKTENAIEPLAIYELDQNTQILKTTTKSLAPNTYTLIKANNQNHLTQWLTSQFYKRADLPLVDLEFIKLQKNQTFEIQALFQKLTPKEPTPTLAKQAALMALNDLWGTPTLEFLDQLTAYQHDNLAPSAHQIRRSSHLLYEKILDHNTVALDPAFAKLYFEAISHLVDINELNPFLQDLQNKYQSLPDSLNSSEFFKQQLNNLKANITLIKKKLSPVQALQAFVAKTTDTSVTVNVANLLGLPIEITALQLKQETLNKPSFVLQGRKTGAPLEFKTISFKNIDTHKLANAPLQKFKIAYRILGVAQTQTTALNAWPHDDINLPIFRNKNKTPDYTQFIFIENNPLIKSIVFKKGDWQLQQDLIIAPDYKVRAEPGFKIDLQNKAKIVSYSALDFKGHATDPIVISAHDSTGQGLLVINADGTSHIEHTNFINLSNPSDTNWAVTGAVTFYQSSVTLDQVSFLKNRSEDALNIVRTHFTLSNSLFTDAFSDALDIDFCEGSLLQNTFLRSGNDATDFSGSQISINKLHVDQAGDKAVSAGEDSQVTIINSLLENSYIGIASKDKSFTKAESVLIKNSAIALTAYQKKSEFGPARLEVKALDIEKPKLYTYLIDKGSEIMRDQKIITAQNSKERKNILQTIKTK